MLFAPCSILLLQATIRLCMTLVFIFYISTLKKKKTIFTDKNNSFSIIALLIYFCLHAVHWNKIRKNKKISCNPVARNLSWDNVRAIESIKLSTKIAHSSVCVSFWIVIFSFGSEGFTLDINTCHDLVLSDHWKNDIFIK